jgi:hypothetical protein
VDDFVVIIIACLMAQSMNITYTVFSTIQDAGKYCSTECLKFSSKYVSLLPSDHNSIFDSTTLARIKSKLQNQTRNSDATLRSSSMDSAASSASKPLLSVSSIKEQSFESEHDHAILSDDVTKKNMVTEAASLKSNQHSSIDGYVPRHHHGSARHKDKNKVCIGRYDMGILVYVGNHHRMHLHMKQTVIMNDLPSLSLYATPCIHREKYPSFT